MNKNDFEAIFKILGAGVTALTYTKDGYTIAVIPPAKEVALDSQIIEESYVKAKEELAAELNNIVIRAEPGMLDARLSKLEKQYQKYGSNHNYSLRIKNNNLMLRQHDLGGCTYENLILNLSVAEVAWCNNRGIYN